MAQYNTDSMIKDLIQINKNIERKFDHHTESLEATQRIIVEKVGGIRSLIELNYKEIIANRNETLENRKHIDNNKDDILENRRLIELVNDKLDKILEKLNIS